MVLCEPKHVGAAFIILTSSLMMVLCEPKHVGAAFIILTILKSKDFIIKRVQVNQDGLKLNDTQQLLAYADDVNILVGSVHTVKENAEALVAATKDTGLEINANKTKYMTVSRDKNAGRIHSMKMDNISIEKWKSSNIL